MNFFVRVWFNRQRFWRRLYLFALLWLTACGNVAQMPLPTAVSPIILPSPPPTPQLLPSPAGDLPPTPAFGEPVVQMATELPALIETAEATAVPPLTISAEAGVPLDLIALAQTLPERFAWVFPETLLTLK